MEEHGWRSRHSSDVVGKPESDRHCVQGSRGGTERACAGAPAIKSYAQVSSAVGP